MAFVGHSAPEVAEMNAPALPSQITAVTVFRSGARVTRRAEVVRGADGFPGAIRLTGLPLCLRDGSVRARVVAQGSSAAPVAAGLRVLLEVPEPDPTLPPPDDAALVEARREELRSGEELASLERERGRLPTLAISARRWTCDGAPQGSPHDARRKLIELSDREAERLDEAIERAREALTAASDHLAELEVRRATASSARQAQAHELRKSLWISLEGGAAARATVEVDYLVPGARWAPSYAVRLDARGEGSTLTLRGEVAQRTGEDWRDVALTLSTAEPDRWVERQELPSLRIGRTRPAPAKAGWRPPPADTEALFADWDRFRARRRQGDPPPQPAPAAAVMELEPNGAVAFEGSDDEMDFLAFEEVEELAPISAPPQKARLRARGERAAVASSGAVGPSLSPAMAPPPPQASAGTRAADEMLAYGDLRMPPATSPARGKLALTPVSERYAEALVAARLSWTVDLEVVVAAAVREAEAVGGAPIPSGCQRRWGSSYDYAYRTEAPAEVPSDGQYHTVPVVERATAARYHYVVVPRQVLDTFRLADVDNTLAGPLLPGPADVYLGGDFLLTTSVDFTPAGAELVLGLGVEQAVRVARNTRFSEDSAGLLGGSRRLLHAIDIEARNLLERPVQLEIRERIPVVSEGEDGVEIREVVAEPAWEPWAPFPDDPGRDALEGGHRWRVRLEPGAVRKVTARYEVRISSKHELVGGNRREE